MHAYLVTGKTSKARLEWANHFFSKAAIGEIVNIEEEKNIVIESIRKLARRLSFSAQDPETGRGVVIENAHLLTEEAANAFLKTLEDPPGNTIFILTAPNKDVVLETIASRASHIDLGPAIFETTDVEKQEAQKLFEKLVKGRVGERLQFLDTIENREAAIKFCTGQVIIAREAMLRDIQKIPTPAVYPPLLYLLSSTLDDLEANVNVKLTVGELLIHYFSMPQNTRG